MPKPLNGVLDDESVHLFQRALFVQPISHPIDPEKFPADGHEYIHRVRLEEAACFPDFSKEFSDSMPIFHVKETEVDAVADEIKTLTLSEWKAKEANFFSKLAVELKSKKNDLMKKYPKQQFPLIENEKDICLFCLGSELYKKIFTDENVAETSGHYPFLSIVLYLSQEEIVTILEYINDWVDKIGMNHTVCRWTYALLACFKKPVSDDCEEFLEYFFDFCISRCKKCNPSEKNQLHLIISILRNYFCIKANHGSSLDKFVNLC